MIGCFFITIPNTRYLPKDDLALVTGTLEAHGVENGDILCMHTRLFLKQKLPYSN